MARSDKRRVIVTGGAGFLGSAVVQMLRENNYGEIFVPRSKEYDLRDPEAILRLYKEAQPEIVIHLAAVVGGIGANRQNPARFFYDNAIMGIQLMEYARQFCPPSKASKSVGFIKRAVQAGLEVPLESGLALERELQQQLFLSDDAREGITAYNEKRKPQFKGR